MAKVSPPAQALAYVIGATRLTPSELKVLVASSEGYDGDDYNRWLAAQFIEVCKEVGTPNTLLLSTWTPLLLEAMAVQEQGEVSPLVQEWVESNIPDALLPHLYGIGGLPGGESLEYVDWYGPLDYFVDKAFQSGLPESLQTLLDDPTGRVIFSAELSREKVTEKSELSRDAKDNKINISNLGELLLYRMMNLENWSNASLDFVFLTDANFWVDTDERLLDFLFNQYKCTAATYLEVQDLNSAALKGGRKLITVWHKDPANAQRFSPIVARPLRPKEDGTPGPAKHFSVSDTPAHTSIQNSFLLTDEPALGHLTICRFKQMASATHASAAVPGALTSEDFSTPFSITELRDTVVLVAMRKANRLTFGSEGEITEVLTGCDEYEEFVADCLPLFLIDNVRTEWSPAMKEALRLLTEESEHRMSYEAKQVLGYSRKIAQVETMTDNQRSEVETAESKLAGVLRTNFEKFQ